jgi:hypothetical protein
MQGMLISYLTYRNNMKSDWPDKKPSFSGREEGMKPSGRLQKGRRIIL